MKKIIVIGGGLAGLSSAVYLSEAGFKVKLLEASPKLGGRAYSFDFNQKGIVDNGQHLLMGSCKYAIDYLKKIDTLDKFLPQEKLSMTIRERGGIEHRLEAAGNLYPLNLVNAIINYGALNSKSKLKLLFFFLKLKFVNPAHLETMNAKEWLAKIDDANESFYSFWDLIINATMNSRTETASASTLAVLLKEIFLKGSYASSLLVPESDLSEIFCHKAMEMILKNGGEINLSERVLQFNFQNHRLFEINTTDNTYSDFDYVVTTVPNYSLKKIYNKSLPPYLDWEFNYAPIVTTHIWLRNNPFKEKFYGLINSNMHWLFNHGNYVTTVTSCADDLVDLSKDDIKNNAVGELEKYFPEFSLSLVTDVKVIKEKRATFIPDAETEKRRKEIPGNTDNLYYAGDWTNTGLPGTIEGAIKSGRIAAENIIEKNRK